jgi:hypothetical protein
MCSRLIDRFPAFTSAFRQAVKTPEAGEKRGEPAVLGQAAQ